MNYLPLSINKFLQRLYHPFFISKRVIVLNYYTLCAIQIRMRLSLVRAPKRKRCNQRGVSARFRETGESWRGAAGPLGTSLDGAAVIQAGQSSRPPRWQQWRRRVSAECVVRRATTSGPGVGSDSSSRSRRFAASFWYGPSDNAATHAISARDNQAAIPRPSVAVAAAAVPSDRSSSRSSPAMHRAHRARDGAPIDARCWA